MGQIGSTEMYLIWERFGPTVISAGLIIITGSSLKTLGVPWTLEQAHQKNLDTVSEDEYGPIGSV